MFTTNKMYNGYENDLFFSRDDEEDIRVLVRIEKTEYHVIVGFLFYHQHYDCMEKYINQEEDDKNCCDDNLFQEDIGSDNGNKNDRNELQNHGINSNCCLKMIFMDIIMVTNIIHIFFLN